MGYVGTAPLSGDYRKLDDISGSFNGSTTGFTLQHNSSNITPGTEQNLLIAVDGVMQEPGSAYTISGTNIVFGSAPQADATFWGVELGDIGGTSVSSSDQILVTATGHSFVVGRWMKATSTDGVYAYADCTTEPNAEVAGVIISVTTDTYTLQVHGTVTGDAVPAQASGTIMFLDASNGQMTTTETSTAGRVSKPLAIVTKNDSEMVILTYRGEVVSSSVQTNAPNNATYVTTTANSTLTNEVLTSSLKIDDFAAGDDNTDLDSSTSRHGLLPKLGGGTTNFLRADGTWAAAGGQSFTGDTTVTSGNFVVATHGRGIDFSANTDDESGAGSVSSELLDDYEEGTFTPIVDQAWPHTTNGMGHATQFGHYTKIGNRVFFNPRVILNGNGDAGNVNVSIRGLPFTCDSTANSETGFIVGYSSGLNMHVDDIMTAVTDANGQAKLNLRQPQSDGSGQSSGVTRDELSTDATLNIAGMYEVD